MTTPTYSINKLAEIFGLSQTRLVQLVRKGNGPTHGPDGKVSVEDAIRWGLCRYNLLARDVRTEKDSLPYLEGVRRLKIEAWLAEEPDRKPAPRREPEKPCTARLWGGKDHGRVVEFPCQDKPTRTTAKRVPATFATPSKR